MRKRDVSEMDSRMGPASVIRPLTDALGLSDFAMNYYELEPGESFAYGFHAHEKQEEVFYVQEGTVTFETVEGDVEIGAGELIRFGPGEYQQGVNRGDERVVALAMGAPQDAGETEILRECADCGERTPHRLELADGKNAILTICEACGADTGRFT
ncbi:MAG TPA: cupin domain-containing protein [Natrialbaceae archaeon]|nr:cupin domain-containing protein [Natrialbaceae archaeon]